MHKSDFLPLIEKMLKSRYKYRHLINARIDLIDSHQQTGIEFGQSIQDIVHS